MKKEEILEASRKENKNKDLAGMAVIRNAGSISGAVGATVCIVLSLLASTLADMMLYSPWIIYFSISGTNWLVRGIKQKKKSDVIFAVMLLVLAILALIGFVTRLLEVKV